MGNNKVPYKIYLEEKDIPRAWYNVRADMKNKPAPLIHPGTLKPLKFEDMQPIFCDELIRQIQKIKGEFPYTMKSFLEDEEAVLMKKEELRGELKEYEDYCKQLDEILNGFLQKGVTMTWLMS